MSFGEAFGMKMKNGLSKKDVQKLLVSLDIFGCDQNIEQCLDDLEQEGQVNLQNLEKIKALSQSDLAILESLENEIWLPFEIHGIIFMDFLINFLVSLYFLYVLIRTGSSQKHLIGMILTVNCQLLFKTWKEWREYWNEYSDSFDLFKGILHNTGMAAMKWFTFWIIIIYGRGLDSTKESKQTVHTGAKPHFS